MRVPTTKARKRTADNAPERRDDTVADQEKTDVTAPPAELDRGRSLQAGAGADCGGDAAAARSAPSARAATPGPQRNWSNPLGSKRPAAGKPDLDPAAFGRGADHREPRPVCSHIGLGLLEALAAAGRPATRSPRRPRRRTRAGPRRRRSRPRLTPACNGTAPASIVQQTPLASPICAGVGAEAVAEVDHRRGAGGRQRRSGGQPRLRVERAPARAPPAASAGGCSARAGCSSSTRPAAAPPISPVSTSRSPSRAPARVTTSAASARDRRR